MPLLDSRTTRIALSNRVFDVVVFVIASVVVAEAEASSLPWVVPRPLRHCLAPPSAALFLPVLLARRFIAIESRVSADDDKS